MIKDIFGPLTPGDRIKEEIQKKEKVRRDKSYEERYQPVGDLTADPPKDGSGVPNKDKDKDKEKRD